MSCGGCVKVGNPKGYTKSKGGFHIADDAMTAAAMCSACPKAGLVMCLVDGKALINHARTVTCPIGRHPKNGVVTWLGINWYGTPLPIRFLLKWRGKITQRRLLPGCGCIKRLKDVVDKIGLT